MVTGTRILASIMFADIVGYTAMMQTNELNAKVLRDRFRKVMEEKTLAHNGTIIQYYGDGCLCIYGSAVESVKSAIAIQECLIIDPLIPVRIGLHIGDVVYDDDGVYGDGVNLASRIESLSIPSGILISDKINDELLNHPNIDTISMGIFDLKNVNRSVEVFAVMSNKLKVPSPRDLKGKLTDLKKSIAVLPFVNMSADPENEYFSDGITEEILNALVKVEELQVTARTSSFMFKGKNDDIREIGKKLGVQNVLEGSVRKFGNKVRITAQLINTADGYHIWSETYSRNLEDIFEIQDEISNKITNTLREKLTSKDKDTHLVIAPTANIDAYNLYLKGVHHLGKWTPEGSQIGIKYFNDAIKLEPKFALPYSSLAFAYSMLGGMGQMTSKIAFEEADKNVKIALELDNNLPEAHVSKALVCIFKEWNLPLAKKHVDQAIKLSPGSGSIRHASYLYFLCVQDYEKALEEIQLAIKLDPFSLPINSALGEIYTYMKNYSKALDQYDKTIELDPNFRSAIHSKGFTYLLMGEFIKSIETFNEYKKLLSDPLKGVTGLGAAYGSMGNIEKAKEFIAILDERSKRDKEVSLNGDYIVIYNSIGDYKKAFEHIEDGIKKGESMFFVMMNPFFEKLRKEERYHKLINKYFKH
ncbi:MAG: tetratricopeptide repeat protein [Melioribacteraceae bacterium]|nr:tetratricopeptide repeat protein [Melioribacteraceae bacterium]